MRVLFATSRPLVWTCTLERVTSKCHLIEIRPLIDGVEAAYSHVLSYQAHLQHDLGSSPEDDAGDHDTSNLFEYDPDVGLHDTQESFDADGQNSDNYDTAVEAVEGA